MPIIKFIVEAGNVDVNGDKIMPGAIKNLPKSVLVTKDFDVYSPITKADVFEENGVIKATAEIPDYLLGLTPAIGFSILKSHNEGDIRIIDEAKIYCVGLVGKNADPSIKSIRDQQ